MNSLDENMMVGSLVAKVPAYAKLFEKLGIDYCCKGKGTLKEFCAEKNVDLVSVLDQLKQISIASLSMDWDTLSVSDLIDHIVKKHHDYLREELPRLSNIIYKVAIKHGHLYPELIELRGVFEKFKADLLEHMEKEETIVFPAIEHVLAHKVPTFTKDSLKNYLSLLDSEHIESGAALEKMHRLTNGYTPPVGACTTHLVLLNGLAALEKDMHEHVHKENHILFGRLISR